MFFKSTFRSYAGIVSLIFLIGTVNLGVAAEKVEVAPGVSVTKKTFPAPINEQPFYGFAQKTPDLLEADKKFLAAVVPAGSNREKAQQGVLIHGWLALQAGNFETAGKRFNQAYLIDPGKGEVYRAFAVLVQSRFKDTEYAEELFQVAKKLPNSSLQ